MKLRRASGRTQGVLLPEHETEMGQEVARKESGDVQARRGKIVAKTGNFVSKCRFTRSTATLRSAVRFPNRKSPGPESLMSRRQLTLVVLTLASLVATACGASPMEPRKDASAIVVSGSSS